jgi:hypothetical protein
MTYEDYKPKQTHAHKIEDVEVIEAITKYLLNPKNSVEQLQRCVASGAINAQGNDGHERDCALGWLAWKANKVADGEAS